MNAQRPRGRSLLQEAEPHVQLSVSTLLGISLTSLRSLCSCLATLRKGHTALFWFWILFPFLWIRVPLTASTPRSGRG